MYLLPAAVEQQVLDVAVSSHLLLFGELHGTCEVPMLVAGLLPKLSMLGYHGLGLEVPHDQRQGLTAWVNGQIDRPPPFYAQPSRDGRGNVQALEMAKTARGAGMQVLCFDQSPGGSPALSWADRDSWMARHLLEQWATLPPGARVVMVCGSLHARLAPDQGLGGFLRKAVSGGQQLWPSLAGWVRQHQPGLAVRAIDVRFGAGSYFNMGERTIYPRPGARPDPWLQAAEPAYTLALWLPRASPATFLSPPS